MKKTILLSALFAIFAGNSKAQVGIGTTTPAATLDIVSKDNTAATKALEINNSSNVEMVTVTNNGQVGINAPAPETDALLELKATNKALLIPRIANTAAIANPVNGMVIYDISKECVRSYENNAWSPCWSSGGGGGGTITALDCAGATNSGSLTNSVAASGVTSVISYNGGNGGTHSGQTVTSTGVTGLTATLDPGSFASGAGTLTYTITGTPSATGTANFAINIGGQTCTLSRTVKDAFNPGTFTPGTGNLSGKTCFDIAKSNDNINSCGTLSGRLVNQSDFTQTSTNTQTYTFTPNGTVSNVRFYYVNEVGNAVVGISGGNSGNNISTAVTATVNYNTNNNTLALGLTNSNPMVTKIYVVYNINATNNNNPADDRIVALISNVKDCACCGAYIAPGVWKTFLCHNLGADTSLDPNVPKTGLIGAYIQWGRRGPNITGDSTVDWQTAPNNGPLGFVQAPVGSNYNENVIAGWSQNNAASNAWNSGTEAAPVKTVNDPCPSGYRVPTETEWVGVIANNIQSYTGTFQQYWQNENSAIHFGPSATQKTLTLPMGGFRSGTNGYLTNGIYQGWYWSSSIWDNINSRILLAVKTVSYAGDYGADKPAALSIRCIQE